MLRLFSPPLSSSCNSTCSSSRRLPQVFLHSRGGRSNSTSSSSSNTPTKHVLACRSPFFCVGSCSQMAAAPTIPADPDLRAAFSRLCLSCCFSSLRDAAAVAAATAKRGTVSRHLLPYAAASPARGCCGGAAGAAAATGDGGRGAGPSRFCVASSSNCSSNNASSDSSCRAPGCVLSLLVRGSRFSSSCGAAHSSCDPFCFLLCTSRSSSSSRWLACDCVSLSRTRRNFAAWLNASAAGAAAAPRRAGPRCSRVAGPAIVASPPRTAAAAAPRTHAGATAAAGRVDRGFSPGILPLKSHPTAAAAALLHAAASPCSVTSRSSAQAASDSALPTPCRPRGNRINKRCSRGSSSNSPTSYHIASSRSERRNASCRFHPDAGSSGTRSCSSVSTCSSRCSCRWLLRRSASVAAPPLLQASRCCFASVVCRSEKATGALAEHSSLAALSLGFPAAGPSGSRAAVCHRAAHHPGAAAVTAAAGPLGAAAASGMPSAVFAAPAAAAEEPVRAAHAPADGGGTAAGVGQQDVLQQQPDRSEQQLPEAPQSLPQQQTQGQQQQSTQGQQQQQAQQQSPPLQSPLHELHVSLGAQFTRVQGMLLPYTLEGERPMSSHLHTRSSVSLFDLSFRQQYRIRGERAAAFLERLVVGDIQSLLANESRFTLFTQEETGCTLDDVVVSVHPTFIHVIGNGCNTSTMLPLLTSCAARMKSEGGEEVVVEAIKNVALLGLQGPHAMDILQRVFDSGPARHHVNLRKLPFMSSVECTLGGIDGCILVRCGFAGEDGFQVSLPAAAAADFAFSLLQLHAGGSSVGGSSSRTSSSSGGSRKVSSSSSSGSSNGPPLRLAGWACHESLRLEAGVCEYGVDLDASVTPVEASLGWAVGRRRRQEGSFPGAKRILAQLQQQHQFAALQQQQLSPAALEQQLTQAAEQAGIAQGDRLLHKRVGLLPAVGTAATTARSAGRKLLASAHEEAAAAVGQVKCSCFAPSLQRRIAVGYVDLCFAQPHTTLFLDGRADEKQLQRVEVAKLPFVPAAYYQVPLFHS